METVETGGEEIIEEAKVSAWACTGMGEGEGCNFTIFRGYGGWMLSGLGPRRKDRRFTGKLQIALWLSAQPSSVPGDWQGPGMLRAWLLLSLY